MEVTPLLLELRLEVARHSITNGEREKALRILAVTQEQMSASSTGFLYPQVALDLIGAVTGAPWHASDIQLRDLIDEALDYCKTLDVRA